MKIVVAATKQFHALSRRQIEAIFDALPPNLYKDIRQVWLESGPWHAGRCEYDEANQRLRLSLVVPQKSSSTTENAIRVLLDGLARLQAGARFFERVRQDDAEYKEFVEKWLPQCLAAAS